MPKNIIITGTSRGIGYELVKQFAQKGYRILALSRNTRNTELLELDNVTSMAFDLTDPNCYPKVKTYIENQWRHVDILINNAGLLLNKPFAKTTYNDFSLVYQTNVFGVAELTRIVLPYMTKQSHVVTISSMGGIQGSVKFPGLAAYSSSKAAIITLTELWAEEYKAKGPQFNALALGAVQTEMLAEAFPNYNAPLQAIEMAQYIYEFSLNANKYYNGKTLQVSSSTP